MKKIILSGICYAILSFGVIHGVKAQISDFEFGFSARVFKKGVKMTNFRPIYNPEEIPATSTNRYSTVTTVTYKPASTSSAAGYEDGDIAQAKFNSPHGICIDNNGNLYVTERYGNRVRKVDFETGKVSTIAGDISAVAGAAGLVNGTGTEARFNNPMDIAVDSKGNLYVAESGNNCIRKITPEGTVTTFVGGTKGYADGDLADAQFNNPFGLAIDAEDNLYVTDRGNHRIRKVTPTGTVTTIAGRGGASAEDGDALTQATFNNPAGIAIDKDGNLIITEAGGNRVRKVDLTASTVSLVAGDNSAAAGEEGSKDGDPLLARFTMPIGVACDQYGEIYVADFNKHNVRRISPENIVFTLAGKSGGSFVDNTLGTAAFFKQPANLAYDTKNRCLYVADFNNHAIRKINLTGFNNSPQFPAGIGMNMFNAEIYGTPTAVSPATDYLIKGFNFDATNSTILNIEVVEATTDVYTITSTAGENGKITRSKEVVSGKDATFKITPNEGFAVNEVKVDGTVTAVEGDTYTFENITADHTIEVTFESLSTGLSKKELLPVRVFPTYATDVINVELGEGNSVVVNIYDIAGNVVITRNVMDSSAISVAHLPAGIYFVKAEGVDCCKIIKK